MEGTYRNYYDSHIHSCSSHDASESVLSICAAAVRKGLKGITFTDHCDIASGPKICRSVKASLLRDVAEARELYAGELVVGMGIELGEAHHNLALAEELAADPTLDFVIGSLHMLRDEDDFYCIDYADADVDSLMERYHEELYELASTGCYDVIGHINYQIRYMTPEQREALDLSRYMDDLRETLRVVASLGKGIEINTSGLQRGVGEILPAPDVIAAFREVGGKIITIGSDAHRSRDVGEEIFPAMDRLKATGFDQFAFFRGRVPEMFDIE